MQVPELKREIQMIQMLSHILHVLPFLIPFNFSQITLFQLNFFKYVINCWLIIFLKISQSVILRQGSTCYPTSEFRSPTSCLLKRYLCIAARWQLGAMKMLLSEFLILYLCSSVYRVDALMLICTLRSCRACGGSVQWWRSTEFAVPWRANVNLDILWK